MVIVCITLYVLSLLHNIQTSPLFGKLWDAASGHLASDQNRWKNTCPWRQNFSKPSQSSLAVWTTCRIDVKTVSVKSFCSCKKKTDTLCQFVPLFIRMPLRHSNNTTILITAIYFPMPVASSLVADFLLSLVWLQPLIASFFCYMNLQMIISSLYLEAFSALVLWLCLFACLWKVISSSLTLFWQFSWLISNMQSKCHSTNPK